MPIFTPKVEWQWNKVEELNRTKRNKLGQIVTELGQIVTRTSFPLFKPLGRSGASAGSERKDLQGRESLCGILHTHIRACANVGFCNRIRN